eukprot:1850389-Rhodomonas_salina.1
MGPGQLARADTAACRRSRPALAALRTTLVSHTSQPHKNQSRLADRRRGSDRTPRTLRTQTEITHARHALRISGLVSSEVRALYLTASRQ